MTSYIDWGYWNFSFFLRENTVKNISQEIKKSDFCVKPTIKKTKYQIEKLSLNHYIKLQLLKATYTGEIVKLCTFSEETGRVNYIK